MSEDADLIDQEIFDEFITECRENLAEWEDELMQLADSPDDDHKDRLHKIFRAAHSIKGAAGFLGLKSAQGLAHVAENVLAKLRDGELVVTPLALDALLKATDQLGDLLELGPEGENVDVSEPLTMLNSVLSGTDPAEALPKTPAPKPPVTEAAAGESSAQTESAESSATPAVDANSAPDDEASQALDAMQVLGEAELKKALEAAEKSTEAQASSTNAQTAQPKPADPSAATEKASAKAPAKAKAEQKKKDTGDETVRVRTQLLDEMMEKIGELVISRNQLLRRLAPHASELGDVNSTLHQLSMITSEVQELVMSTRLQPVALLFRRFPRLVRDVSRKLGKEVVLEVDDGDAELDRTLIEALADPLTHLVRNSLDHGIEMPDKRMANGKNAKGVITLRAVNESGMVNIEVVDNGGGIDPQKIGSIALSKGVITEKEFETLSPQELVNLIFAPGFSTAEQVTDLSGRGVGMDVVRTNIANIGGTVEVTSEVGKGSVFSLKLPLTLAVVTSLIVEIRDALVALPQLNLEEVLRLNEDKGIVVETLRGMQVLKVRGHLVPIVCLGQLLSLKGKQKSNASSGYVLLVQAGRFRYGILVDTIHDSEEMVVKPMPSLAQASKCFSGTSILGDGRIALILDPNGIAEEAQVSKSEGSLDDDAELLGEDPFGLEMKLVKFGNGGDEIFGIPMSLVGRIEKIPADSIHPMGKREFVERGGKAVEVLHLSNIFDVEAPSSEPNYYTLIVPKSTRHSIGFLGVGMCDVVNVGDGIERSSLASDLVVGTVLRDDELVAVIDVFGVENKVFGTSQKNVNPGGSKRVLIAEDSPAFQEMQRTYFESVGYVVDVVENGEDAWNQLLAQEYDVLVSDICMPKVDGFELIDRVRHHATLKNLPAVAVTTLRSDDDKLRILAAGYDGYELKVDRHRLITAVTDVLYRNAEEAA
ncbi:MAG: hybrid sensor histidine kinase/response regulator [Deltaproteobacteria bacterium]|nr:hybrid sensor histidine kinase/response regulator [Deltaproteobacteria bacterium]